MPRIALFSSSGLIGFGKNKFFSIIEKVSGQIFTIISGIKNSTDLVKYGSASLKFDGSSNSAGISYYSPTPLHTSSTSTTIECWVYVDGAMKGPWSISSELNGSGQNLTFFIPFSTQINFSGITTDGIYGFQAPLTTPDMVNKWNHIVVQYSSTNWQVFLNGTSVGQSTFPNIVAQQQDYRQTTNSNYFFVGGWPKYPGNMFAGYVDDIRVSNGLRYSGNFTPPASKLTVDETTLALFQAP